MFVTVPSQADRRHFAYAVALDCGLKKQKLDHLLLFCCASCNCCHYFSSKARLIRGPDMILQEVRGECIASGVSVILAFCRETYECHKSEDKIKIESVTPHSFNRM